ncbi:hypothetical protein FACS1894190_01480 [Spirochaetia bacterium]|nr:hypothetical protein FACS1894190_01480 [Spirochaetia bacterium]
MRVLPQGIQILYEDREVIVVNKPCGILSVAAGGEGRKTVYWVLTQYLSKKGEKTRPAMVHRLDRGTSGVLLVAKSERVKRYFMENWKDVVKERSYGALVEGVIAEDNGTIDAPLNDTKTAVFVSKDGKPAVTHWKVIKRFQKQTLVNVELETGRRNQIRAHFAYIRHPVCGDKKYGGLPDAYKTMCLHAGSISFLHPKTGAFLKFSAAAPKWKPF